MLRGPLGDITDGTCAASELEYEESARYLYGDVSHRQYRPLRDGEMSRILALALLPGRELTLCAPRHRRRLQRGSQRRECDAIRHPTNKGRCSRSLRSRDR